MAKPIPSLGELELQVLRLVWREQPCTERRVTELVQADRPVARTTVLKTMQRLEEKGLLVREARSGSRADPVPGVGGGAERLAGLDPAVRRAGAGRVGPRPWRRTWPTRTASGSRRRTWKPSARSHARSARRRSEEGRP